MYEIEQAALGCLEGVPPSGLVKLILTGKHGAELRKDLNFLSASLRRRFYFIKVRDNSSVYINPADYRNDISLKGEFIRLTERENLSEEMKSLVIASAFDNGLF
jgi:hypothetical protein